MRRYLVAAFLLRLPVPGLGDVPFNLLAVLAVVVFGLALPPVWLLGLGLEIAYLFALATNARFHRLVDARERAALDTAASRPTEAERLAPEARRRLEALEAKVERVLDLYEATGADAFVAETNRGALGRLVGSYAELLRARETLDSLDDVRAAELRVRGEIAALEGELGSDGLNPGTREAKSATLDTLRKRVEHLERRESSREEIDSYLARIEAQVDLALDSAALRGRQEAISADIDVASFLLDDRAPVADEADGLGGGASRGLRARDLQ